MFILQSQFPIVLLDMARKSYQSIKIASGPHLTFLERKYFITMGLRSMKWDEWIGEFSFDIQDIPTSTDLIYPELRTRQSLFEIPRRQGTAHPRAWQQMLPYSTRSHGRGNRATRRTVSASKVYNTNNLYPVSLILTKTNPSNRCAYLPERYPSMFTKTATGITNKATNETFNITQRPLPEDPMATAARLVQDDLALMFERADGEYYLLAGAILLAGFWRLSDKFGMRLSEIHTSGDVPGYKSKLEKGMMNFFRRLRPEEPVLRNNYFIQVDDELAWSHSIGSEDAETVSWNTAEENRAIENHFFRSERQSLRRLPRSGAVVFTIRTYFEPIARVAEEPYVPGRLADAIRSWGDDVSRYKGREKYQDVLLEYLDQKHREQVEGGLEVEKEDEVRSYPY